MRCGWAVGGIFENQFPAQVSLNLRHFRKVTLNLNFKGIGQCAGLSFCYMYLQ